MGNERIFNYKISVIVPIYNAEKTLNRCIDSILAQTYDNLEVILVNDGSLDHSIDICYDYQQKDSRVIIVDNDNQGTFLARKTGYEKATGDFIGFVDSDDFILPLMYEYLVGIAIRDDVDIIESAYCTVDLNGNIIKEYVCKNETVLSGSASMLDFYYTSGFQIAFSLCNKLFSRKIFIQLEDCPVRKWDDVSLLVQLLSRGRNLSIVNKRFYCYVQSCDSTTRSSYSLKRLDEISAAKFIYNFHKKNSPLFCKYQIVNILVSCAINYYHLSSIRFLNKDKASSCFEDFKFYIKELPFYDLLKTASFKEFILIILFNLSPLLSNVLISILKKL